MILYDYPTSPNCMKVRILLRHLDMPHECVALDPFRGETREAAHLARNPDGRVPTLELEDGSAACGWFGPSPRRRLCQW